MPFGTDTRVTQGTMCKRKKEFDLSSVPQSTFPPRTNNTLMKKSRNVHLKYEESYDIT